MINFYGLENLEVRKTDKNTIENLNEFSILHNMAIIPLNKPKYLRGSIKRYGYKIGLNRL